MKTIKIFGSINSGDLVEVSVGDTVYDEATATKVKILEINNEHELVIEGNTIKKAWEVSEVRKPLTDD